MKIIAGNAQADNDNDRLLIWGRNLKLRKIIYTEKSHTHTHRYIYIHRQTRQTTTTAIILNKIIIKAKNAKKEK